ncbi:Zinc finger, CCHC-type [Corchorus olitorius]|uniref:Zinc finger, CCHC-type n=1 Tax=Corchorus olitorius TaxID=93759 RepID=A0A1R3FW40_9ROSI|nr:Zinc finger, CCHC-type [Corchorus olitorius]
MTTGSGSEPSIPKPVDDALRALEQHWGQPFQEQDARHRRFETTLEMILERLDTLGIDANNRRNNRQPRVEAALGESVNRHGQRTEDRVEVDNQITPVNRAVAVVDDDLEDEELEPNRVVRYQPQRNHGRRQNHNYKEEKAVGKRVVAEGGDNKQGDNPYAKFCGVTCYRCNQQGHRTNECPSRKTIVVVDKEADDDYTPCDADEDDEEDDYDADDK